MFSWSISKSAEAMFTRWAIKRLCKFLLKKKLGKFILGDIDLNQLDVQLGAGTIQLSDLALNVDYINEKLGTTPVLLKEGSIGSLMVIMPWKDGGCRIEVEELEVVLAPRRAKASQDEFEACSQSKNGDASLGHGFRTLENETPNSTMVNASVDVHEGVKTIAKMVKWLLTNFCVKIKKMIVAFDPLLEEENREGLDRILVLRISEVECGTHISEDEAVPLSSSTAAHNFLGLSRLTNFLKFHGAVLELLNVNELDLQSMHEYSADMTSANRVFSGYFLPHKMTTVISGERGGFSGKLKLSLPWKNGSLDIRKVDTELHIEPLELRLEPSSIRCFILMWDLFKGISEGRTHTGYHEPTGSLSDSNDCIPPSGEGLGDKGVDTCSSFMDKEPVNSLLSEHLISDWVSRSQRDRNEREPDFGASVDQFFECFDELRSSQSSLGNSGMWNWTSSVFSAITAASSLASGSLQIPCEQQHVETNFTVAIEKMSLLLSFIDEEHKQTTKMKDDNANGDLVSHFVCAHFVGLSFSLQVYRLGMDFEGTVQHVQLVDHLCPKYDSAKYNTHGYSNNSEDIASIQKMQDCVQGSLQTFYDNQKDPGAGNQVYYSVDISLSIPDTNGCFHMTNGEDTPGKFASVTLLKTSGVSSWHVRIDSCPSGASLMGPTSFSLKLPPFVFWVNFDLITMTLELMKNMSNCIKTTQVGTGFPWETETENFGSSPPRDRGRTSHPQACNLPNKKILKGDIFLPYARVILSFPHIEHSALNCYSSCNQFIGFDFMSRTIGGKDVRTSKTTPVASSSKRHTVPTSCTLNINFGDLYVFSISTPFKEQTVGSETCHTLETKFSVDKIISVVNRSDDLATVSMFWQEGPTTGPWISNKAKLLASENVRSESKIVGKGCEFASVTTVKDGKDHDSRTRQEILSSSTFLFHVQLPSVTINLDKSQYGNIFSLLNRILEQFSSIVSESARSEEEHPYSQAAFLVKFDSMTVCISAEPVDDVNCTQHPEFPGSWRCLTLNVDSFELLSVSHIGGTRNANFLWITHGIGSLWGSITKDLHREFLLISCSESAVGRGDGEGSNVLSSRCAGSDFIKMWDPKSKHYHSSVTTRCATIVATGGRLDWFSTIFSFFSRSSADSVQAEDNDLDKTSGSSFMLKLEDVGLSYEPYLKSLVANQGSNLKSCDQNLACLLVASSVKLSNTTGVDCTTGEYKIMLQDLGLLIHKVMEPKLVGPIYSVEHLRKIGYVKVAQEAHVEALLKTKSENGYAWELECQESHVMLNTCCDTTSGLIRLAAQLQNLFAPDMEDYIVHMENRWNNAQKVHENRDEMLGSEFSESHSHTVNLGLDKRISVGNLMDEIHEDVFQLDGNTDGQAKLFESNLPVFVSDSPLVASGASLSEDMVPTFIEEYFLQDLHPLSGVALGNQSHEVLGFRNGASGKCRIGNDGWYADSSLRILEDHTSKVEQTNTWKSEECKTSTSNVEQFDVGKAAGRITFKNMNVTWRMYGGFDWSNFQDTRQTSLTCGRDTAVCLELLLSGIEFDYDVYPAGEISASRISLAIQDICLNDRSADAPWKLVLGYYQSKKHPRNFSSKAVKLNLEAVRPDPSLRIEENRLRVSLFPIRLHLHQSQLDFLISFFGGQNSTADPSLSAPMDLSKSGVSFENHEHIQGHSTNEEAFLTYFQKFDIRPLLIRVDYSPCRVDLTALRDGKYVELVNLVPWKGVELQLKHVQGVGLYGWSRVCETILGEWLEDISHNQIHKLLKGLPPIKSLVAVGSGAAKLVSLPVKSYRKDHRLLKGMQRGTFAFLRGISLEAIGLGVHLAAGAHNVLLQAEYILASIPPSVPWPVESRVGTNVKSNQPADAQQGIQQACQSISEGLGKSASALVQNPLKRYQRGAGMGSALATAVQSAPAAAIAPASATVRAVHCALLGFRNSLDPERKNESLEKYLGRTPSRKSIE